MKTHKLPIKLSEKVNSSKKAIAAIEINNLKLKLNLAQIQINLLQGNAEIEKQKASISGLVQGFAITKKLNVEDITLSEDGLSIIEDGKHNN